MKKLILKNKYLFLPVLFLLTVVMSVPISFTTAKYTKTVDVGTIRLEFTKEDLQEQLSESFDGTYTVKSGDTLYTIAEMYNTSVEKLQAYNNIEGTVITAGSTIKIPPQEYVIHVPLDSEDLTTAVTDPTSEPVNKPPYTESTESSVE